MEKLMMQFPRMVFGWKQVLPRFKNLEMTHLNFSKFPFDSITSFLSFFQIVRYMR